MGSPLPPKATPAPRTSRNAPKEHACACALTCLDSRNPGPHLPSILVVLSVASSGESLAVILLDVDDFKSYNDYYGHDEGDEVLSKVAAALAEVSKAHDGFAARYGGEEFFVMLPGKDEAAAEDIAWELVKSIRELDLMHRRSSNGKFVTISAGLHAGIALQNKAANSWISKADQALYFAKYSGRDQVKIKNK